MNRRKKPAYRHDAYKLKKGERVFIPKSLESLGDLLGNIRYARNTEGVQWGNFYTVKIARRLGVAVSTISRLEYGQRWPSFQRLTRYLDSIGVDLALVVKPAAPAPAADPAGKAKQTGTKAGRRRMPAKGKK